MKSYGSSTIEYTMSQVQVSRVPNWQDAPLSFKQKRYPQANDPYLPRMYFVGLFVGSRGSGKTYTIVKLLKQYERAGIVDGETKRHVAQRVILMSPTHDANPVFSSLEHLAPEDVHASYTDSKLIDIVHNIKVTRAETETYQRQRRLFNKFLKIKRLNELTHDELVELEAMGYEEPEKPKYPDGCVTFLILDDLIGSPAFKQVGRSALTELVLKNRHLGICILIACQNLKSIPKAIRTNTSLFAIFRFASKRIITDDLYEEVSNILTLEQFERILEYATHGDHDCLVIDFTLPRELKARFKQNLDRILSLA